MLPTPFVSRFTHLVPKQNTFSLWLVAFAASCLLFGATPAADASPDHKSRNQRSHERHDSRRHSCRSYPCNVCHRGYSYAQRQYDRGQWSGEADGRYYGFRDGYYSRPFCDRPQRLMRRYNRHYRKGYHHGYSRSYRREFERGRRQRYDGYGCR